MHFLRPKTRALEHPRTDQLVAYSTESITDIGLLERGIIDRDRVAYDVAEMVAVAAMASEQAK
jgi:hypothetical protein